MLPVPLHRQPPSLILACDLSESCVWSTALTRRPGVRARSRRATRCRACTVLAPPGAGCETRFILLGTKRWILMAAGLVGIATST